MPRRRRDPDPIAKLFGEAVRAERLRHKWSLEELGSRMDADGRYLGEIERGFHVPTLSMAKRIADALGVPVTKLVAPIDRA